MRPWHLVLLGTAVTGPASTQPSRQASPDIICSNGKIITVDERFTIARAVAVEGERILAVGGDEEIEQLAGPIAGGSSSSRGTTV
jgi:hypothetical protein